MLSAQEQTMVQDATTKAEAATSGEIITIVTRQSDRYLSDVMGVSIVASFLLTWLCHFYALVYNYEILVSIQILIFALSMIGIEAIGLVPRWAPIAQRQRAVQNLARQQFLAHGLHNTKHRATVLILVSLREKCVELIADIGIDSKVPPQIWNDIAHTLSIDIKTKTMGQALSAAIEECARHLQHHFPSEQKDENLFSDSVTFIESNP